MSTPRKTCKVELLITFHHFHLKQFFFTVNDTPFPIAIVRKTTPPLFFVDLSGGSCHFLLIFLGPFFIIRSSTFARIIRDFIIVVSSPHTRTNANLALCRDTLRAMSSRKMRSYKTVLQKNHPLFEILKLFCNL